jgi:hypothetical protein
MELCSSDKLKARQFLEQASAFFWANFSNLQIREQEIKEKKRCARYKSFFLLKKWVQVLTLEGEKKSKVATFKEQLQQIPKLEEEF